MSSVTIGTSRVGQCVGRYCATNMVAIQMAWRLLRKSNNFPNEKGPTVRVIQGFEVTNDRD